MAERPKFWSGARASWIAAAAWFATSLGQAAANPPDAAEIVARTIEVHGGGRALADIRTLQYEVDGRVPHPFQSRRTTAPYDALPLRIRYWLDFAGERAAEEYFSEFPGGYRLDRRRMVNHGATLDADHRSRTYTTSASADMNAHRYHPLVLLKQFAQGATLELRGLSTLDGRSVYEVAATARSRTVSLLIDARDGVLRGLRSPRPHLLDPHALLTVRYLDYRTESGWLVPARVEGRYLDEPVAGFDVRVRTVAINAPMDEAAFSVPAGYVAAAPEPTSGPHVRELAPGIHLVERLLGDEYNALIVEFADHLMLVEAPLDEEAGAQLKDVAARIGRDKPVRYLVLTHAHEDHAGGIRAVLSSQPAPTVVSTVDAEQLLRAAAAVGQGGPTPISYERVAPGQRRMFAAERRKVEIINLGANPHTEELLVLYFPEEKLLFQADMLTIAHDHVASPPGNAGTAFLDEAIDALRLDVAYVAGAHGALATRYDLRKAAAQAREAHQQQSSVH